MNPLARRGEQHLPDQLPHVGFVVGLLLQLAEVRVDGDRKVKGFDGCRHGGAHKVRIRPSPLATRTVTGLPLGSVPAPVLDWETVNTPPTRTRVLTVIQKPVAPLPKVSVSDWVPRKPG